MSFIWPVMLSLLLLLPVGVAGYLWAERRRRRRIAALAIFPMAAAAPTRRVRLRRSIPAVSILAGLAVLIVALARPQAVVGLPRHEGLVILAFDVSGSMSATDLAPSRIEAAKTAARAFVERQPSGVLVGVVAFSDAGFSVQVPTNEPESIHAALDRLAPERGTSLGQGIGVSLDTIAVAEGDPNRGYYSNRTAEATPEPSPVPPGTHTSAVIVLLTDGENTMNPHPLEVAQEAADRGVRIHTVGIGSAAGITIEVNGFTVHTRLDEPMLQGIAELTGGSYYHADDPEELRTIYETLDPRLVVREEAMEITALLAGAGLVLLLVGALSSLFWLGRLP